MYYTSRNRRQDDRDENRQNVRDMCGKMKPISKVRKTTIKYNELLGLVEVR